MIVIYRGLSLVCVMIKNDIQILSIIIITISLISAQPLSNLAFAEIEDGCKKNSSAIAGVLTGNEKAKQNDIINIDLKAANNSLDEFEECVWEMVSAVIFVNGNIACEDNSLSGIFAAADQTIQIWKNDESGVAGAGGVGQPGQCLYDTTGDPGGWIITSLITVNVFNRPLDTDFLEATAEPNGGTDLYSPSVNIDKQCDAKGQEGEPALCTLTVTNNSTDDPKPDLTNCVVTDPNIPSLPSQPFPIPEDQVIVLEDLETDDLGADGLENTARVDCDDQDGPNEDLFDTDTAIITVGNFAVNINKECNAKVVLPFDTEIECTIDVEASEENTGPITNCEITDDDFGGVIVTGFSLNQGQSWPTENVGRAITEGDVIAMMVTNTATVICDSQDDTDNVENSDNATVDIFSVSASITDVCEPETQELENAEATGSITWTITICNTSPDGKSELGISTMGTIEMCDVGGENCQGPVDEPEKEINIPVLPASDPFDADVSCEVIEVTKDVLGFGKYIDVITGSATMQAGEIPLFAEDMCEITLGEFRGCTPGFWKGNERARDACQWVEENPGDDVIDTFNVSDELAGDSLLDALKYKGGNCANGGTERQMLRMAVAAKLNIEAGIDYEIPTVEALKLLVNTALDIADPDDRCAAMKTVHSDLGEFNEGPDDFEDLNDGESFCPLSNARDACPDEN